MTYLDAGEGRDAPEDDEEAAAAAWAAAAGGGDEERAGASPLSQDEIDSLLGFDAPAVSSREKTGVELVLERALQSCDHLPMLEVVFDRLARMLSTSLRNFTSENVDVDVKSITSMRFGDYINSIPVPAVLAVFKAQEWENFGVVTFNGSLVYSMVEVLFGGRRSGKPIRIDGRPYTTIERNIINYISKIVLMDMSDAFDPLSPVTMQLERLETNPRFATVAQPSEPVILVKMRVDMDERGGVIEAMLPLATLEPIKPLLAQSFIGDSYERDSAWEAYMTQEVVSTEVEVQAALGKKMVRMRDVGRLRPGRTLILDTSPDDEISLYCGGVEVLRGKPGRAEDDMAVVITAAVKRQQQNKAAS